MAKRRPGKTPPKGTPRARAAISPETTLLSDDRRSLGLLRAVIDNTSDIIFIKDKDSRYILANRAFGEAFGHPPEFYIGGDDTRLFPPEKAARVHEADRLIMATGQSVRIEDTQVIDGELRHFLVVKNPYRDESGAIIGIVGVAADITELKRAEAARLESEARYRLLVESSPDGNWVHRAGVTLYVNPAMVRMLGARSADELVGRSIYEFIRPHDHDLVAYRVSRAEHDLQSGPALRALVRLDGSTVETEVVVNPSWYGGLPAVQAVVRDVSERMRAEAALRETEERYALAAAATNDGLWDWDLRTGAVYFSPRWRSMLGLADDHEPGAGIELWFSRVHEDDRLRLRAEMDAHLHGTADHLETSYRARHEDGTWRWMLTRGLAVRDGNGQAYRFAGSQTDITERKQAEVQLLHDALHDGLTRLPNRALFMEELRLAIDRRRRRPEYGFTVLFLDLDRFKVINDSLGHMAGDSLLVQLAERLERCLRPGDRVARLGGDEFTILLDDIDDVTSATHIADRIHVELDAPFDLAGREVFTSASIGIALSRSGYEEPEAVLRDADLAMYRAKGRGGATYEVFDLGMHASAVARLELETDLRRAVERQEFRLVYQPIFSGSGSHIAGFEALVRWEHPRRGLIDPATFISVAEETNVTVLMGRWVMGEACRQLRRWHDAFIGSSGVGIGVNISGKQLLAPGLAEDVARTVRDAGIDARFLHLEITENVLMHDADTAADVLAAVKAIGVNVHMDDFGTGYSSLSYLRRFPLDGLKIDRFFVSRMEEPENLELVRTIVALARNLGLQVIAEGVENAQQWTQLRSMSCELVQGFLFSAPLDEADATKLLATRYSARTVR